MGFAGDQPNRDNIDFTPVGSAPSDASEGATIYHTTSGLIFYTGVEWVACSGAGGGGGGEPDASDTVKGIVELATLAEVDTGTDTVRAVTPAGLGTIQTDVDANTAKSTNVSTDLSYNAAATTGTVTSSDGTNATLPAATTSLAGLQTGADKTKLDGIETSATADQTGAEIKSAYEGESDTNAFTDANVTLLGNTSGTNTGDEPDASATVKGIVELATLAEVDAGTDTVRAVTPAGLGTIQTDVDANTAKSTNVSTDLSYNTAATTGTVISSDGTNATIPSATKILAGLMTGSDKIKLDDIEASASASLSGLSDTTLSSLTSGDAIRWNGSAWVNQQDGTPAVPSVSDLDDTTITSVASGDVLTWNGAGLWVNEAGGGGSLSGLSDTTLTAPASGSILSYNGSEWIDAGAPIEVQTSGYVRTLVASGSVSAGTSFDTPTLAGLGYESVEVLINNIDVSTDMYFKATAINASDTELTGASDYGYQSDGADQPDGSAWGAGSKAAAFIGLAYVGGTAASRFGAGTDNKGHASIRYKNISEHAKNPTTSPAVFDTAATYIKSGQGGRASTWTGGGWYNPSSAANALDSIRIATNTGTWTGNWQVWADVPMSVLVTEAAAVTALSDLSDTTTTAPASGEVLQYDGSTWANAALAEIPTSGYQWKLLESKSAATAGTSVSFTGLEDYSAREIRIVGQGLELGGKDADYKIEMLLGGTDDVVNTGAADYMRSNWNLFNTTNSNAGDFADDSIVINTTTSEAGGSLELMDFDCKITGIDAANHAFVNIEGLSVHNNSSAPNAFNVKARHNVLEELGVVQILHQDVTDVWTGGTFDLWGLVPISVVVSNAQVATATTTELVDNSHSINTSGLKVAGYMVFNTTTGAPVWSVGSADGSIWNDSTGSTKHTPV